MSRQLSPAAIASINASETDEVWLAMLELTHDDWDTPVRLVRNTENITHAGQTFSAFPFDLALPDEEPETMAVVKWAASNVSLELMELFRSVNGPINGSIFWVLASDPDLIEIGPLDLQIRGFEYDAMMISGSMTIEPVLDAVFGSKSMDGSNAPGLF